MCIYIYMYIPICLPLYTESYMHMNTSEYWCMSETIQNQFAHTKILGQFFFPVELKKWLDFHRPGATPGGSSWNHSWFMFVEPCQAVGLFLFKWVLNVFLCFSPALNLEYWYMEHYPWCWKRTGYQVEVSILNTAVKESSKRLPETGSKE